MMFLMTRSRESHSWNFAECQSRAFDLRKSEAPGVDDWPIDLLSARKIHAIIVSLEPAHKAHFVTSIILILNH